MLIQAKGDVAKSPCRRCSKGAGPMTECVTSTVRGEGACANCFYHGNGHKCSFRASEMPESRKDLAPKEVPVAEEEDEDEVPRIRKRSQLPRRGKLRHLPVASHFYRAKLTELKQAKKQGSTPMKRGTPCQGWDSDL